MAEHGQRRPWVYAIVGVTVLGVLAAGLAYVLDTTERPFGQLATVGTVRYEGDPVGTAIDGDYGYFAYRRGGGELHLVKLELATGERTERTVSDRADDWGDFSASRHGLLVYAIPSRGSGRTLHVYDPATLEELYTEDVAETTRHFFVGDRLIRVHSRKKRLAWIDPRTGDELGDASYGTDFYRVGNWSEAEVAGDLAGHRFQQEYPDNRLVTLADDGTLRVLSAEDGQERKRTEVPPLTRDDRAVAYQGLFFVAGPVVDGDGWQLTGYDIDKLTERPVFTDARPGVRPERVEPCGEAFLCVLTSHAELVVVDFKAGRKVWATRLAKADEVASVVPVGDRIMVTHRQGRRIYTVLYDREGTLVRKTRGWGAPADSRSVLLFPDGMASVEGGRVRLTDAVIGVSVRGAGAQTGEVTPIGTANLNPATCSWDAAYLLCAGSTRLLLHRFR
ncbi:MAG: PQQ-binding-like beta-propeller repeat protein [Micromonosporaceae bacterium]